MDNDYDDGRLNFYYSREERLKKASQAVRDINDRKVPHKKGLFRTLTATKPLTFLFLSIITICAAMIILSLFMNSEGVRELGNNSVSVSAIGYGENSYITVKKAVKPSGGRRSGHGVAYAGPVDIAVSIPGEGNPIHVERLYFGMENEELFRFIAPFRGKKLVVLMDALSEQVHLTVTCE